MPLANPGLGDRWACPRSHIGGLAAAGAQHSDGIGGDGGTGSGAPAVALGAAEDVHFDDGSDHAMADSNDGVGLSVTLSVPSSEHDNFAPHRDEGGGTQAGLGLDVDLPAELSLLSTLSPADVAASGATATGAPDDATAKVLAAAPPEDDVTSPPRPGTYNIES